MFVTFFPLIQPGDDEPVPFSYLNDTIPLADKQLPCHITYTNEQTHELVRNNRHLSPDFESGDGTIQHPLTLILSLTLHGPLTTPTHFLL